MTQLSKRLLDKEIEEYLLSSFSAIIQDLKTQEEVDCFLTSILTKTERSMIAKRILAAYLIRHNIDQKQISDTLKLTAATVNKLSIWAKLNEKGFNIIFNKLEKERRKSIAKNILLNVLDYAIRASSGNIRSITKIKL